MYLLNFIDYFHDGSIINIEHSKNTIVIEMRSAEVNRQELEKPIKLSKDNRIQGKLHIEDVNAVKINEQHCKYLKKSHEIADILDLEISKNKVELQVSWNKYPPNLLGEDFSSIEIEAQNIYWENIPDLTT